MSGAAIASPTTVDTTLIEDSQPAQSITPADIRQMEDSLSGIFSTTQTGNYTLVLADRGTRIRYNSASNGTVTLPPHASVGLVVNTMIMFCQIGAGQLAIAAGAGVTIITPSSLTTRTQGSTIFAIQDGVDSWVIGGDLT